VAWYHTPAEAHSDTSTSTSSGRKKKMKISKRQLKRIIKESIDWTPEEKASYDEGFEQGNHDAIEQMGQGEVMRHMFDSQEEYDAFVRGYDDGYNGTMDVLPSKYH
jgi:hypothetical protein